MTLHLALFAAFLSAQDPDLAPPVAVEDYDFEIRPPAGWKRRPAIPPALVKFLAPEAGPAGGEIVLIYHEFRQPKPLPAFIDELKAYFARQLPGSKVASERDLTVGAYSCRLLTVEAERASRQVTIVQAVIQRNLGEYYILDAGAERKDAERLQKLLEKVLVNLRVGLPLAKEESDALGRLREAVRAASSRPGLAGETFQLVTLKGMRLGYQRQLVREKRVDGAPGYEFESDTILADADGGRHEVRVRGAFALDGSVQRADCEEMLESKADGKSVFKESVALRAGEATAAREIKGVRSEARFRVPEGTYLSDAADVLRRHLALGGKAAVAFRVLQPFRDEPEIESLEVAAAEPMKLQGSEREIVVVLTKSARRVNRQYYFEKDGALSRLTSGRGAMTIERCTREEALK